MCSPAAVLWVEGRGCCLLVEARGCCLLLCCCNGCCLLSTAVLSSVACNASLRKLLV